MSNETIVKTHSRQLTQLELAMTNVSMMNVYNSIAVNTTILNSTAYELYLSNLGAGCPPLQNTIELNMMWHSIADTASKTEH